MPTGRLAVDVAADALLRDVLVGGCIPLASSCGGQGICGNCGIRVLEGTASPVTEAERRHLSDHRLKAGWRLACQARLPEGGEISLKQSLHSTSFTPLPLRGLGAVTPANSVATDDEQGLGLAVDIGTTHVRATLWDLHQGQRLNACYGRNPQARFGLDVLSRLEVAGADKSEALSDAIVSAIGELIGYLVSQSGAPDPSAIRRVTLVGNTAMLLLLTQTPPSDLLEPNHWEQPVHLNPQLPTHWRSRWGLNEGAKIGWLPPLAGFIGSDFLACLTAAAIVDQPENTMVVDFGTNTELALWDGQTIWATSAPGCSALEGVGIGCGMSSEPGAVCRLKPGLRGDLFSGQVIDDLAPRGLCATAIVDAVAELLRAGGVRPSGRLAPEVGPSWNFRVQSETGHHEPVPMRIVGRDIDALQRAKASVAAAMETLLALAGRSWSDVSQLTLCGFFGHHLDTDNAKVIGLIPDLPRANIRLHGNAALAGCERALLDPGDPAIRAIADNTRVFNLARIPDFDEAFIRHLRLMPIRTTELPRRRHAE
jgi:uncharacterized 2Fe-2S/4Fe-4S cluster protein (DUF4445 family)